MKKQIFIFIKHIFSFIFFIVLAFGLSWLYYLWAGYPGGADAIQHTYRLKVVAQFFPHHTWLHTWAGGMPHFIIYPTLPYIPMALLMKVMGWTSYFTLFFFGVFSFGLLALAVYFVVYALTGNWMISFLSGVLILANQGTWQILQNGVFARVVAAPFMVFSWAAFVKYWKEYILFGKDRRTLFIVTSILLALTFVLHFFMGILAALVIGTMAILTGNKFLDSVMKVIKLGVVVFLLTASILLPIIFLRPPGIWVGEDVSQQLYLVTPLEYYFYWHNPTSVYPKGYVLAYYFAPLTILSVVILVFLKIKRRLEGFYQRIAISLTLLSIFFFVYNQFPISLLGFFYNQFLPYLWVLSYLPLFLTIFIAVAIWSLLRRQKVLVVVLTIVILAGIGFGLYKQYDPHLLQTEKDSGFTRFFINNGKAQIEKFGEAVIDDEKAFNFRFGDGNYGEVAVWFNVLFPFIPQTRDFFFPGIVNPDFYFYLIKAGWFEEGNYFETNFLFDWWGVKEFVAKFGIKDKIAAKFSKKAEYYNFRRETISPREGVFRVFEYREATPLLATNNSPAILVIGRQPEAHTTVFRSLAYGDFNSRFAIPVEGKEFIDDYKLEELRRFPIVFLYQSYSWRNFEKAGKLLKDYVSSGGRLIIEANRDLEHEARLPEVYPVVKAKKADIEGWQLDGGSWGGMVASELKEGASSLLAQINGPILVEKRIDDGTIIWSGMNLPFHTIYYHNPEESKLMAKILAVEKEGGDELRAKSGTFTANSRGGLIYETSVEKVEFVHPEKRILELKTSARGILFKEAYFPNWKAKLNGKGVRIYKAGPGFMYVPLTKSKDGDEIEFVFGTHFVQWLGRILSIGTFLGLIFYLFDWWILAPVVEKVRDIIQIRLGKVEQWWGKEEI